MASKSKSKKENSSKSLPHIDEGKPFLYDGKICRIEKNKIIWVDEENSQPAKSIKITTPLPIPLMDEETLYQLYAKKFIAILDGKIIGVADSLRKLHQEIMPLVPKGKDCTIRYIEEGVSLYGIEN